MSYSFTNTLPEQSLVSSRRRLVKTDLSGRSRQAKTDPPSKNRVWNFSTFSSTRVTHFSSKTPETTSETTLTTTKTVSGLPFWPSRDPIGEKGGKNLYAFVHNTPLDFVDYLGNAWWSCRGCPDRSGRYDGWKYWLNESIDVCFDSFTRIIEVVGRSCIGQDGSSEFCRWTSECAWGDISHMTEETRRQLLEFFRNNPNGRMGVCSVNIDCFAKCKCKCGKKTCHEWRRKIQHKKLLGGLAYNWLTGKIICDVAGPMNSPFGKFLRDCRRKANKKCQ